MPISIPGTNVTFTEHVPGSPRESWSYDTARVTRMLDVDWTNRFTLISLILGYSFVSSGKIVRTNPMMCPEYPWLFATHVDVEGIAFKNENETFDMATYQKARLTVQYEPRTYQVLDDDEMSDPGNESNLERYITRTYHPAGQFVTVPTGQFLWVNGADETPENPAQPIQYGIPRIEPFSDLGYTWHQVPTIPVRTIEDTLGKINIEEFDTGNPNRPAVAGRDAGYEINTLLFVAADITPIRQPFPLFQGDNLRWDIYYRFKYVPHASINFGTMPSGQLGHNYFLRRRAQKLEYRLLTDTGATNGNPVYQAADFTNLFKPDF